MALLNEGMPGSVPQGPPPPRAFSSASFLKVMSILFCVEGGLFFLGGFAVVFAGAGSLSAAMNTLLGHRFSGAAMAALYVAVFAEAGVTLLPGIFGLRRKQLTAGIAIAAVILSIQALGIPLVAWRSASIGVPLTAVLIYVVGAAVSLLYIVAAVKVSKAQAVSSRQRPQAAVYAPPALPLYPATVTPSATSSAPSVPPAAAPMPPIPAPAPAPQPMVPQQPIAPLAPQASESNGLLKVGSITALICGGLECVAVLVFGCDFTLTGPISRLVALGLAFVAAVGVLQVLMGVCGLLRRNIVALICAGAIIVLGIIMLIGELVTAPYFDAPDFALIISDLFLLAVAGLCLLGSIIEMRRAKAAARASH